MYSNNKQVEYDIQQFLKNPKKNWRNQETKLFWKIFCHCLFTIYFSFDSIFIVTIG